MTLYFYYPYSYSSQSENYGKINSYHFIFIDTKSFDDDDNSEDAENLEGPNRVSEVVRYSSGEQSDGVKVNIIEGSSSALSMKSEFEIANNQDALPVEQEVQNEQDEEEREDDSYESEEEEQEIGEIDFAGNKDEPVKMMKKNLQIEVIDYNEDDDSVQKEEYHEEI